MEVFLLILFLNFQREIKIVDTFQLKFPTNEGEALCKAKGKHIQRLNKPSLFNLGYYCVRIK